MRIAFAGTPDVAIPALEALIDSEHEVVAVITRPDARAGRGKTLTASPVADIATEAGLEVLKPASVRDEQFVARLRELQLDAVAVVAYGALLPQELLDIPRHGWINLHFSVLPAWRGAAPVQFAIWRGDDVTGASTFRIEAGLDTGPVFGVMTRTIASEDTGTSLLGELARDGAGLLVKTMDGIADGSLQPQPQAADGITVAPKITTDQARVDWTDPAIAIDRMVRALTTLPGAWTMLDDQRVRIEPVTVDQQGPDLAPGHIAVAKRTVHVGTGSTPVLLGNIVPPGKRSMPAVDWFRGRRLDDEARFT